MESLNAAQLVIEQCSHIPQLLSVKDVGSYTGLSRSTIYEMVNENLIVMIQRSLRRFSLHK